jgi:hypothetical protein
MGRKGVVGFTDIVFDEIEVSYTAETRMRIDNLQLGEPVGAPFQISSVEVNPDNDEVTVVWPSRLNERFSIEWSEDPGLTHHYFKPSSRPR